MTTVLSYSPGQTATILLQILGSDGYRADGYSTPVITGVLLPDLTSSPAYPLPMNRISTGLYYHRFTIPTGSAAVGTYIVDLTYTDHLDNGFQDIVQVLVNAPQGQFSITPG